MEPLHIFFHVATLGRWSAIYDHIVNELEKSGLLNHATLHVSVVGDGFSKNVSKYILLHQSKNTAQYEFPTLNMLWNHCAHNNGSVLYIHTKGATRPGYTVDQWREMMMHFCVNKWQRALHHLHDHDAVGCNIQNQQNKNFFSGNFWWAKADYIKTLPDPNRYLNSRIQAELWIGMNPINNFYNLHSSNVNHYITPYPFEKYMNVQ